MISIENNGTITEEQGNSSLSKASVLSAMEIASLKIPKPPTRWTPRALAVAGVIFACVFGFMMLLLNLPAATSAVSYTATHSEEKDNQALTDQYRALYGYTNHPELSYVAQAPQPQTSNIVPANTSPEAFQLSIQKLGLTAPVVAVQSAADAEIMTALKNGVVMYPGSAMPGAGQAGQTVIIGHSSSPLPWNKYSAIFANLGRLEPNDLVHLTVQGKEYIYRVSTVRRGSVQDILSSGMTGDLILSTCWPVGTDTNRVAVAAVRVQ